MIRLLNILCISFFFFNAIGQNLKDDLFQAGKRYLNIGDCKIEMNIKAYNEDTEKLEYTVNGVFVKKGNKIFQETEDYIFLVNDIYSLLLSKKDKEIIFNELNLDEKKEYEENTNYVSEYLDLIGEVVSQYDSINYLGSISGERKYVIYTSKNVVYKTLVSFDIESRLVNMIEYNYLPGNLYKMSKLVLNFKNSLNHIASNSFFDEKQFIIKQGQIFTPSEQYKNYKVFNNKVE